ncbi:hypothetical protein JKP88DRAFT_244918 [Tribonema minus]|uniref:Uncharacterized protein n=1 Tax=Tribonema minus TaxID=303371 RepID=A0A835Z0A1_9STRA|nr:hypothetical protein JKP88DRAFT_244918 [Tribonema minus]
MQLISAYTMPGELPYRAIHVPAGLDLDQVYALRQALRLCLHQHVTTVDTLQDSDMALSLLFRHNDDHHTSYDMWFDRFGQHALVGCWTCTFDFEGIEPVRLPWPVFGRRREGYEAWFPFTVIWNSLHEFERCAMGQLLGGGTRRGWELQNIAIESGVDTAAHAWRATPVVSTVPQPRMMGDDEAETDTD